MNSPGTSITNIPQSDHLELYIQSLNLSEDLSKILSTRNDELLIFIYLKEEGVLGTPLFQKKLTLDEKHMEQVLRIEKDQLPENKDLLFLLLEQDYDTPVEQLDPIIRVQHQQIIQAFDKRDYQKLRTFLGTEDLLGYKIIKDYQYKTKVKFSITGVYKADFYEYNISLGPQPIR